jgi:hypothetical protein
MAIEDGKNATSYCTVGCEAVLYGGVTDILEECTTSIFRVQVRKLYLLKCNQNYCYILC